MYPVIMLHVLKCLDLVHGLIIDFVYTSELLLGSIWILESELEMKGFSIFSVEYNLNIHIM